MKLTRKQLNYVLASLPHPLNALEGRIAPFIRVPVYEHNYLIQDALLPSHQAAKVAHLTFEYDRHEMDWVLKELDL